MITFVPHKFVAVMTTHNRIDLLERTIDSYMQASTRPEYLIVFDDCSDDVLSIKKIISRIPEAVFIEGKEHLGVDLNNIHAISTAFNDFGASAVVVIDSDCEFKPWWWHSTRSIVSSMDISSMLIGLCNLQTYHSIKAYYLGMVFKSILGGLGMVISRNIWEKTIMPSIEQMKSRSGWDYFACELAGKSNIPILACSPSLIQHTGTIEGSHIDSNCISNDFEKDQEENIGFFYEEHFKKHRIPKRFCTSHPDWDMPSMKERYRMMLKDIYPDKPISKKVCIAAFYDEKMKSYVKMFEYCAKKAYPEYDVKTFDISGMNKDKAPAIRFLYYSSDCLEKYDYVLFTDIDILFMREDPGFVEQHVDCMNKLGLRCYNNYVVDNRMIGVHFITKDWWNATRSARQEELEILSNTPEISKTYDEEMLLRIVKKSGLPTQNSQINLWSEHGIHLGKYRKRFVDSLPSQQSVLFKSLMTDKVFSDILNNAKEENDTIACIFNNIRIS